MCGICGVFGTSAPEMVQAMVAALHHRGPDDHGLYTDDRATMGMARLQILDTTETGHQPMANEDRSVWIVYNGELYNFQSERRLLEAKGFVFRSTSDTEVVLRLYEAYRDECLHRMRGMFAFAVYDKRGGPGRERLLLARDPLGIKPLLYAWRGTRLIFASEIKALLASRSIEPRVDPVSLRQLLTYGSIQQPRTILQDVRMLLPGHKLIVDANRHEPSRYWSLAVDRCHGMRQQPYPSQLEAMTAALEESVRLQMVSDVPLGAFLSGGIDSSVLVAMMARLAGKRIKTFSVGFEAEGSSIDESHDAQRTAEFLGTDHHRVLITGDEVRERIRHIAWSLDQPTVDGVNSYFISQAARQGVTVSISGTGGDELFAGYPWFINMVRAARLKHRKSWKTAIKPFLAHLLCQSLFDSLVRTRMGHRLESLRGEAGFVARYATNYHVFGGAGAARILNHELHHAAQSGRAAKYDLTALDELPRGSTIERVSGLCLRGYTTNQLLRDIDAASMTHSLEIRVPYLDTGVLDLALSLPDSAKLSNLEALDSNQSSYEITYRSSGAKRILLDIGAPLLPEGYDCQPKRGFGLPFATWLKGPLRDVFLDATSDSAVKQRGLLNPAEVATTCKRFERGEIGWAQPWLLMMLELWGREVLDRAAQGRWIDRHQ